MLSLTRLHEKWLAALQHKTPTKDEELLCEMCENVGKELPVIDAPLVCALETLSEMTLNTRARAETALTKVLEALDVPHPRTDKQSSKEFINANVDILPVSMYGTGERLCTWDDATTWKQVQKNGEVTEPKQLGAHLLLKGVASGGVSRDDAPPPYSEEDIAYTMWSVKLRAVVANAEKWFNQDSGDTRSNRNQDSGWDLNVTFHIRDDELPSMPNKSKQGPFNVTSLTKEELKFKTNQLRELATTRAYSLVLNKLVVMYWLHGKRTADEERREKKVNPHDKLDPKNFYLKKLAQHLGTRKTKMQNIVKWLDETGIADPLDQFSTGYEGLRMKRVVTAYYRSVIAYLLWYIDMKGFKFPWLSNLVYQMPTDMRSIASQVFVEAGPIFNGQFGLLQFIRRVGYIIFNCRQSGTQRPILVDLCTQLFSFQRGFNVDLSIGPSISNSKSRPLFFSKWLASRIWI